MGPEKGLYTDLDTAASSEPLELVQGQLPRFHAVDRIVVGDGSHCHRGQCGDVYRLLF